MSDTPKKFHPAAGHYISEQEATRLKDAFFKREKEKHNHEDFTRAYFFGKDKLQELLNYNTEIVGMRIYYGVDVDGDGIDDKKMVLYPVGKDGKDILMYDTHPHTANRGAGADAASIETSGGGKALDGGLPCPLDCP